MPLQKITGAESASEGRKGSHGMPLSVLSKRAAGSVEKKKTKSGLLARTVRGHRVSGKGVGGE